MALQTPVDYSILSILVHKEVVWLGSSLQDLKGLPEEVCNEIGHALCVAQRGGKAPRAKPLSGYKGASVLEIVENYDSNTYRCVYTVRFEEAIYVLHSFMKKSAEGSKTPKRQMDIVDLRLKRAEELHEAWQKSEQRKKQ